ncbi:hypothetical protein SPRG_21233 [Saprolegnia parasitica CBS 223.65]|uniref:Uncharacterized protein n=1 Tax=Saprolegnia parasitica (strain CBS 223.65) TaxID=695850 RepID=A0A067BYH1_SAPPC|nr:hypothetical protein SPRG_21233 [Saprolegnia parasitica CBS 223.65]KDO21900.1 hypothetical protein SPRG_21233 [Saprolegnia parasitica CBS 223.65]|eukprot:XP_012207387.1 hypothetical protein SPRG_21233 [Saprolegnia parasitica CBS 223.65]
MQAVAQRCLAVIGDVRSRPPLPDITDYVFGDIQLDASHCKLCARLVEFLNDGTQTRLELFETMCDPGQRCVDANHDRLVVQHRWLKNYFQKVQPRGGVSESQLAKHVKAQRMDAEDRARVAALEILLANAQQRKGHGGATEDDEDDDEAAHSRHVKRQRRPSDR